RSPAGILGGTGVLLFLVAFGTDYWLLATDTCGEILIFHHEGFFWRCWFFGEGHPETIWTFWYTSQAHPKFCMHGYLFPMPIAVGPFPHPSYDTTAVYRGFWTAFILLAVAAGLVGGLLLVCGVPFSSSTGSGGGSARISASAGFVMASLPSWWGLAMTLLPRVDRKKEECLDDFPVRVYYGWSFMFAAAGVPLVLLSGLLFFLVGRDILDSLQ
uniref:Transmembrane protein 182 n=1 Tax=Zosterops lateralis melanops TaxID=1220523 RepID=A0A8D2PT01_ZOSLA